MIKIARKMIAYNSYTMDTINPEYLYLKKEDIVGYEQQNPYPNDAAYSFEDLLHDLTNSSGMLNFPSNIKQETIEYIEDLLNELI